MIHQLASFGVAAIGLVVYYLIGTGRRWTFLVATFSELAWIAYGLAFNSLGFTVAAFFYGAISFHRWYALGREKRAGPNGPTRHRIHGSTSR